jgi:transposase
MTTFHPHSFEIPEETIQVAQASFPKGSKYMTLRDKLGPVFKDDDFEILFSSQGQAGQSPAILALVTVLQHMEGLTDREAADAVRGRIDWKYLLGLPLTDSGFHYSILSPFRDRLLKGGLETQLFEKIILKLKECDLLADKRQQRTDSTHVLAAVRTLNRLECVGETMRRVLDDLARLAPDWLLEQITPDWFKRYSVRVEKYRLPKEKSKQQALQQQIGEDGWHLLKIIYHKEVSIWFVWQALKCLSV